MTDKVNSGGSFQSTFPRGERLCTAVWDPKELTFQSTFPRGERPRGSDLAKAYEFQSTFPRGERRECSCHTCKDHDFNPRSRVGNDLLHRRRQFYLQISIHVPAWGTTGIAYLRVNTIGISIHVPAWGTTFFAINDPSVLIYFNPRSRVGNDHRQLQLH